MGRTPSFLILDIETVPDPLVWKRPETPHGQEPPFPPTYAHRVIVIGCMWLDAGYRMRKLGVIGEGRDECGILEDFSRFVDRHRPAIVTYNGRVFDLPVIALRSLHHGVPMPWYYRERGLRYRYSEEGHIDLCDWLADHGATRSGSLDALARLVGLPGKLAVDGSQIEGLYKAGRLRHIQDYCLSDVTQTALLFLRFRLLQGVLDPGAYCVAVSEMVGTLRHDPRLAELMGALDEDRLLAVCGPIHDEIPDAATA